MVRFKTFGYFVEVGKFRSDVNSCKMTGGVSNSTDRFL